MVPHVSAVGLPADEAFAYQTMGLSGGGVGDETELLITHWPGLAEITETSGTANETVSNKLVTVVAAHAASNGEAAGSGALTREHGLPYHGAAPALRHTAELHD